jgi:hypothetical protein
MFEIRKKAFVTNQKFLSMIFLFGCLTIIIFILSSPLTASQSAIIFVDDKRYLFWLMYTQTSFSIAISAFLAISGSFYLYCMIDFMSMEFKIFGKSISKLLNQIDENMSELQFRGIVDDLKGYVKHHQRLLS